MPSEALWLAAVGGHHEDIRVAVVLAREGDELSIRRKLRAGFMTAGGQLPRVATVAWNGPQIAAVCEDNFGLAQRGSLHQERSLFRSERKASRGEQET